MSGFTETVKAHPYMGVGHLSPTGDLAAKHAHDICLCGWTGDEGAHPEHLESVLAGAGVVAVELPTQSGDPFRARDIVERAAIMRQQYRAERCAGPLSWGRATDAQKVHWIIRAAADLSAAAVCPVTPEEPDLLAALRESIPRRTEEPT